MILQDIDGILCRNAGDGQAEDMGRLVSTVDLDLLKAADFFHKLGKKGAFVGDICRNSCGAGSAGCRKAGDGGSTLSAAAVAGFLSAAVDHRREGLELRADIQCARTLGAMDLMGGNADQICPQHLGREGDLQKTLYCVGVEDGVGA